MQRNGWILAVAALLLIGVGLYFAFAGDENSQVAVGELPRVPDPAGMTGSDVDVLRGTSAGAVRDSQGRRVINDGGVSVARVRPRTDEPAPAERSPTGATNRGIPRSDPDENRSAGWRLGQARRRLSILQDRAEMYQSAVDRFVAEGRPEVAERQRVVLERVQRRMAEFEAREPELIEAAEADGTMSEVDQGYEEGEVEARPPSAVAGAVAPR